MLVGMLNSLRIEIRPKNKNIESFFCSVVYIWLSHVERT